MAYVLHDATPTAQYKLQTTENTKRARRNFQDSSVRGLLKIAIFGFNPQRFFLFFFSYFQFLFTPPPRQVFKFLLVCVCVLTAGRTPRRSERVPPAVRRAQLDPTAFTAGSQGSPLPRRLSPVLVKESSSGFLLLQISDVNGP